MTEGPTTAAAARQTSSAAAGSAEDAALLEQLAPVERLAWAHERFGNGFAITTSFGIQSSVLLHMLSTLMVPRRSR